jgi:tRNA modification GTPase
MAERQLEGGIAERIGAIEEELFSILSECEANLDFTEEHYIKAASADQIKDALNNVIKKTESLLKTAKGGIILRDGIKIVIAGHPNSGKSSLFNLLAGRDRAIVTEIAGTTRDTVEEDVRIGRISARLVDTAGIREADDIIEKLGIERSKKSIDSADIILWLLDPAASREEQIPEMRKHLRKKKNTVAVWNKSDLLSKAEIEKLPDTGITRIIISVKKNEGIEKLFEAIEDMAWGEEHDREPEIAINLRHKGLIEKSLANVLKAVDLISSSNWEIASLFLRDASLSLGEIRGDNVPPNVLDMIFEKFCIGK